MSELIPQQKEGMKLKKMSQVLVTEKEQNVS